MEVTISRKDIRQILNQYNLGRIINIKKNQSWGNFSYNATTGTGKYTLRLCGPSARFRSRREILAEIELINYLRGKRISTPASVANKSNQVLLSYKGLNGYLRKFCDGKEKMNPNKHELKIFGEMLGSFHNAVEGFKTKERREHTWDVTETKRFFEEIKNSLGDKDNFKKSYEQQLSQIKISRNLPKGMIHEDLGKRHVLWRKDKIVGIIDFDRSYYGPLLLDLGQACRGWCFIKNWRNWSNDNFKNFLSGYTKKRKLTPMEKNFLFTAIKFAVLERALSFYLKGSTDRRYALFSLTENGALGLLEKNKQQIEAIIKAA